MPFVRRLWDTPWCARRVCDEVIRLMAARHDSPNKGHIKRTASGETLCPAAALTNRGDRTSHVGCS